MGEAHGLCDYSHVLTWVKGKTFEGKNHELTRLLLYQVHVLHDEQVHHNRCHFRG